MICGLNIGFFCKYYNLFSPKVCITIAQATPRRVRRVRRDIYGSSRNLVERKLILRIVLSENWKLSLSRRTFSKSIDTPHLFRLRELADILQMADNSIFVFY